MDISDVFDFKLLDVCRAKHYNVLVHRLQLKLNNRMNYEKYYVPTK